VENTEAGVEPTIYWFHHWKPGLKLIAWPQADISKIPLPAKEDATREGNTYYPTGYIVPFHFRHPVSGKETSEKKRNARLKAAKNAENQRQ